MDSIDYERLQIKGIGPQGLGRRALQLAMASRRRRRTRSSVSSFAKASWLWPLKLAARATPTSKRRPLAPVIGAALNSGLVEKEARSIHALMHATEEAQARCAREYGVIGEPGHDYCHRAKPGLVAVAFYGESSLHVFSCHERVGLGVMHLPDLDSIEK